MAINSRQDVENARTAFAAARSDLIDRLYDFEKAQDALREAQRTLTGSDLDAFETALQDAETALADARTLETQRQDELADALDAWIATSASPVSQPEASAEEDFSRLESATPIVLFPIRVETRFLNNELWVRVFPDEILLDTHEVALTEEERDAARAYYETLNEDEDANERALWRDLIARFGVTRSAYILRQMLPVFGSPSPTSSWTDSSSQCGGTIAGGGNEALYFPAVQLRSSSWTKPGEAVLPDRWMVVVYRGNQKRYVLGNRIIEPLAMTPDPKLLGDEALSDVIQTTDGAYKIDDKVRWTVDFDRAVNVGMGIRVQLQGNEWDTGFDRVVVVGVKTSMSPLDTSRALEKLIDAQHYTRGIALVRQGSPTNNTNNQSTPYPPVDDAGKISFAIERQPTPLDREVSHHCMPHDVDGYHLARMLGVPSGVMANVDRAKEREVTRSLHMNRALWYGTLGYFMRHMMDAAIADQDPIFTSAQIEQAGNYFSSVVLSRGPAPAFRVGPIPYGVLPIASLAEWEHTPYYPSPLEEIEIAIREPLLRLLGIWLDGVSQVPRITPSPANPDYELSQVLATYPSAREFWFRGGKTYEYTFWEYFIQGWNPQAFFDNMLRQTRDTFERLGLDILPAVGTTRWDDRSWIYTLPAVADELSETLSLPFNPATAINAQITTNMVGAQAVNEDTFLPADAPRSLFREMLRRSALSLYAGIGASLDPTTKWVEIGLFGLAGIPIQSFIPSVYQADAAGQIRNATEETSSLNATERFSDALAALGAVPSAELDRLFRATMDLCSRRIDAWITAFAYRRLLSLRSTQESQHLATVGDFMGGYGWLENVRRIPRVLEEVEPGSGGGRMAEQQPGNGGFVHCPSMTHAAAAALLRNAHLSSASDNAGVFAVDLSSRRVRTGRELFEGVRNGQHLGALLGYKIERGLHDKHPGVGDTIRFALRRKYPLVANKTGNDSDDPAESIAARNVVDGAALVNDYLAGTLDFSGEPDLPTPGQANFPLLEAELKGLVEAYDAAADLLTSEAAFQLVSGNIDAASPTISNVVEGRPPPDSVISRTARGGVAISHAVSLVFHQNSAVQIPTGWPDATPRADAEPVLDAWLGRIIGDPTQIGASVSYLDEAGETIDSIGGDPTVTVTLDELGLRPLDLLAIAEVVLQSNQGGMLDRRIVDIALNDPQRGPSSTPASIQVDYLSAGRTLPQTIEVLNAAHAVLKAARPLKASDLVPAAEVEQTDTDAGQEGAASDAAVAFYDRSTQAQSDLQAAYDQLDAAVTSETGLRPALIHAALFVQLSAYPDPNQADESKLLDSAKAMRKELGARLAATPEELSPPEDASTTQVVENAKRRMEAVFGEAFVSLPEFDPPAPAEIALSLGARSTLLTTIQNVVDDAAPDRHLQQMMRSRPRLGRYRKLNLYARTAGLGRPKVEVVQLPYTPGERWLGLPFDTPPEEGRTATLLLSQEPTLDPIVPWKGLVIDNWNDIIPRKVEETGVALHYNSPQAQAPQAVLVVAPSRQAANWSFAEVLASLEQTMDLMKVRAIETEHVDLTQVFPPMVMGQNPNILNTITTDLSGDALAQAVRELFGG